MGSEAIIVPPEIVPPGEGESYWTLGDLITFKIGPDKTGGAWSLAETTVVPGGGPPPHLHMREDETFYILDGEMLMMLEDDLFLAKPGDAFFLPRGRVHTFHNPSKTKPAKMLVMASPCGFEKFMMNFARPRSESATPPPVRKEDIDKLMQVAPQFGIEMKLDHKTPNPPTPARTTQRSLSVFGSTIDLHLMGKDTREMFLLSTIHTDVDAGVPPHAHREQDELSYILAGRFEYNIGGSKRTALPGTTIYIPRKTMHSFSSVGPQQGRFMAMHFPSEFENFFLEADAGVPNEPGKIRDLLDKHGMDVPA